ncbi:MAG: tRNA (adenosine(37)-N6)-threonylcarbamoyltransferase complex ATPase subunit type 1 TsaE [Acholeplasmatales bacterium]|jgi:tRNA threonylcarbamoyladenosine biosynthesis protein TsaE|nr:tRNA (adenosine(37)-N6)-threonylcarbamoyltransferase complex ATPase subunit type 1 TsaE [Acholeplasmatales bacterium]
MKKIFSGIGTIELTKRVAYLISKQIVEGDCILLGGDLGSGKTTFTKFLGEFLGIKEIISSPTFTILKQYETKKFTFNHFDFYRLSNDKDNDFDFIDYIEDKKSVSVIEWYNQYEKILPTQYILINFKEIGENRLIEVFSSNHIESIENE